MVQWTLCSMRYMQQANLNLSSAVATVNSEIRRGSDVNDLSTMQKHPRSAVQESRNRGGLIHGSSCVLFDVEIVITVFCAGPSRADNILRRLFKSPRWPIKSGLRNSPRMCKQCIVSTRDVIVAPVAPGNQQEDFLVDAYLRDLKLADILEDPPGRFHSRILETRS